MSKELMKGVVDILILLLIKKRDTYGYEITKHIKEKSEGFYTMGEGTLYPALKRLESKELITSYWLENELTGKRKYYKITEDGKIILNENLNQLNTITSLIDIFKEA
jgi:PadR family transcriptional regulator PadR